MSAIPFEPLRPAAHDELAGCEREPIHIPGAVQPHGVLLVLSEPRLKILRVSDNADAHLGRPAAQLLNSDFLMLLEADSRDEVRTLLQSEPLRRLNPMRIRCLMNDSQGTSVRSFDGIAHRHKGRLILELEPVRQSPSRSSSRDGHVPFLSFYHQAKEAVEKLREARDLAELCQAAVDEVRQITTFDRVVIYRFDPQWNGRVVAEARHPEVDSYMDLHFPASDIPRQARELYRLNRLRLIPNVDYRPAKILTAPGRQNPYDPGGEPLDLSLSVLRSVSPVHLEYLRNMRCDASMSISILREGELWGLVSLTHLHGPLYLPYEIRALCEFLGEIMSSLLPAKEANEGYDERLRMKSVHASLLESMTREPTFTAGLMDFNPALPDLVGAQGAAIYFNGRYTVRGKAPSDEQIAGLVTWLSGHPDQELLVTDSLPALYPPAAQFKDVAAGLLAASLSRGQVNYVLWFRPEVVQTVNWGGNPNKPVEIEGDGSMRLHPRKSFDLWKETVRGKAVAWTEYEVDAARELRKSIIDVVLQKSEELQKLNTELERSNDELDSFAYAASHDLKEPLRGIHNFSTLILREMGENTPPTVLNRMQRVVGLTQRMEALIDSLLHYSQVGRLELSMRDTDMNGLVGQAVDMLRHRLDEAGAEVSVHPGLPHVMGDRVRLTEVFTNLITNAIKYNDKAQKHIEIGSLPVRPGRPPVFFVRDNGIGIGEEFREAIFRIFKRLHARDKFGGGSGTGLTITKRIIERHGGSIWLESRPGMGSTFLFTLAPGPSGHEAPGTEPRKNEDAGRGRKTLH